ncbi:hypothetical protein EA473_02300 [Natrarchaeobius chitinivorans]|uniref:Uncharacterized protein n=1 Tax=Natrarchaeobius chitinivorans TaxID=1679083 RepID=A0A3N6MPF4_NATCH|nr:hypothetical protein EA473_02300 [Natrarchaeobius chitinivorans]
MVPGDGLAKSDAFGPEITPADRRRLLGRSRSIRTGGTDPRLATARRSIYSTVRLLCHRTTTFACRIERIER